MSISTNQTTDTQTPSTGLLSIASGNLAISTAGKGLQIKTGSNAKMGTGTLVAGTVTVSTTAALSTSYIFIQVSTPGGVQGNLSYSISNATSFTVTSDNVAETSSFVWLIVDPA